MNAQEVAKYLKKWALEHNLFKTEVPSSVESTEIRENEVFGNVAHSAISQNLFRSKGISAIAFNDAINEVIVFTEKSIPQKDLKLLPSSVSQSVAIRYVHSGVSSASTPNSGGVTSPYGLINGIYACGSSIHPAKFVGAGTLGCLVTGEDGLLYGLTNNHVSGLCNYANFGEKILAPGHIDIMINGIDPFTIGYHACSLPMQHGLPDNVDISANNDAALIKIADPSKVSSMQGVFYDTPTSALDLQAGFIVEKVGRTTGRTRGRVSGQIVGGHPVNYSVNGFAHVSYFDPVFAIEGENGAFSASGDSGSLITTELEGTRYAVGIVFAGNPQGVSFALPLKPILDMLRVSLVSNHNT